MNLDVIRTQRIDGETVMDRFGAYSIEVDGEVIVGATGEVVDLNGDGFLDLVVGAGDAENGEDVGKVYIFFGEGNGRFGGAPILDASQADIIITGEQSRDFFGAAVSVVDVDGDGLPDLAIGAPGTDFGGIAAGSVYLFLNKGSAGNYFVSDAEDADHRIDGNQEFGQFGGYIAAGDLQNDGLPDLAVGAPLINVGPSPGAGAIYTFFNSGAPNFFANNAGGAAQMISGATVEEGFGTNILPFDINNDGLIDLVVGSPLHSPAINLLGAGAIYIFLNDGAGGFPTTTTTADQVITGAQAGMNLGACVDVADLNDDGDLDLAAGAPNFNPGSFPGQGALFIFFKNGSSTAPFFGTDSDQADLRIDGEAANNNFGQSCHISNMDDLNGLDLVVGATRYDHGTVKNVGAVYVFLNEGGGVFAAQASQADLKLVGEAAGDRFGSGLRTGDLNNDGKTDLLIGARLASYNGEDSGSIYVFLQTPIPPPGNGKRPPCCEKVLVDLVLCDEIFYFHHEEIGVPLGIDVPPGSVLSGTVQVTLAKCDLSLCGQGFFVIEPVFIVQKELVLTTPNNNQFELEFLERLAYCAVFRKCSCADLEILDLDFEQLNCQIIRTEGVDTITLDPLNDTFSEDLTIELKVKITAPVQKFVKLCSYHRTVDIPISQF